MVNCTKVAIASKHHPYHEKKDPDQHRTAGKRPVQHDTFDHDVHHHKETTKTNHDHHAVPLVTASASAEKKVSKIIDGVASAHKPDPHALLKHTEHLKAHVKKMPVQSKTHKILKHHAQENALKASASAAKAVDHHEAAKEVQKQIHAATNDLHKKDAKSKKSDPSDGAIHAVHKEDVAKAVTKVQTLKAKHKDHKSEVLKHSANAKHAAKEVATTAVTAVAIDDKKTKEKTKHATDVVTTAAAAAKQTTEKIVKHDCDFLDSTVILGSLTLLDDIKVGHHPCVGIGFAVQDGEMEPVAVHCQLAPDGHCPATFDPTRCIVKEIKDTHLADIFTY